MIQELSSYLTKPQHEYRMDEEFCFHHAGTYGTAVYDGGEWRMAGGAGCSTAHTWCGVISDRTE